MHELKFFVLLSWISLPTVMFGGYALLSLVRGKLNDKQQQFFRLGHAHAGILLILSLVYIHYLTLTTYSVPVKLSLSALLTVGIIMQSGGFFWHAFLDKEKQITGIRITSIGAVLLATSVIALAFGLFSL